ncbi:hypothetical protein ES703_55779 [subsurface metagenome]
MKDKRKIFVAISGDVVASTEIRERENFQQQFLKVIEEVNKNFGEDIAVPFSFTRGDEVQGLTSSLAVSLDIAMFFSKKLYPQKLRFGIGCGGLSTQIHQTTARMDGDCFHFSRGALEEASKRKKCIVWKTGSEWLDTAINTMNMLIETIQKDWKEYYFRRFWLYQEYGNIKRVSEIEGITKQAVAKSLAEAHYQEVLEAQKKLRNTLRFGFEVISQKVDSRLVNEIWLKKL